MCCRGKIIYVKFVQVTRIFICWRPANVNDCVLNWLTLTVTVATPNTTTSKWIQLLLTTSWHLLENTAELQVCSCFAVTKQIQWWMLIIRPEPAHRLVIRNTVSSFLKKLMLRLISPSGILTNVCLGTSRTLRWSSFFVFLVYCTALLLVFLSWTNKRINKTYTCKEQRNINVKAWNNSSEYEEIKKKHVYERIKCPVLSTFRTFYSPIRCLIALHETFNDLMLPEYPVYKDVSELTYTVYLFQVQ